VAGGGGAVRLIEWFAYKFLLGRCDWFWSVYYRYQCPYPIIPDHSVRACCEAGHCGCDNADRFYAHPRGDGAR
jgi:hypothetical protein